MTKFKTVKRKANVGERILITYGFPTHDYKDGDILTVGDKDSVGVYAIGAECHIGHDEYEVIEVKPDTYRRLSEAEAKIATLEAEVKALKTSKEPRVDIDMIASALSARLANETSVPRGHSKSRYMEELAKASITPNQRRADVIKRAQAFVADLEERAVGIGNNEGGNATFRQRTTHIKFYVNAEKRVVTALALGRYSGKLYEKAFAKCSPGDVFNADIGKAVALGRALGVMVPKEFTDAVKPTEVVVGMVAEVEGNAHPYKERIISGDGKMHSVTKIRNNPRNLRKILDDTDAVYV
ncbi:hypothetical protein [Sporosarcina psychrophila]|uniref:Uncharacterized protein n=1 Tax=Sporosarcina psychrophila TaxID=1476 RepID=A0ABV2KC64_SPOPS